MKSGSCRCGRVKISVAGDPENVRICHCRLCQKTMGSPFFARALFLQSNIHVTGDVKKHASSDSLERVFLSLIHI